MLTTTLDEQRRIAILEPDGRLSESDFRSAAAIIDPFIERAGHIRGLIIHTRSFPGWESFPAMLSHLTFIREHHKKVPRIAFVTDSVLRNLAETIGKHFVSADIKSFRYQDMGPAITWIVGE
jgi:hypothetical protein